MNYHAVLYYEKHPCKDEVQVFIRFPDLCLAGFPASTAGSDKEDAIEAAKDILDIVRDIAKEDKMSLPASSRIDQVNIKLWDDIESVPYRIEIVTIES